MFLQRHFITRQSRAHSANVTGVRHQAVENSANTFGISLGNYGVCTTFECKRSPSWRRRVFCSGEGSVTRRRRISRPSAVGRTVSAVGSVESQEMAFMGGERLSVFHSPGGGFGPKQGSDRQVWSFPSLLRARRSQKHSAPILSFSPEAFEWVGLHYIAVSDRLIARPSLRSILDCDSREAARSVTNFGQGYMDKS